MSANSSHCLRGNDLGEAEVISNTKCPPPSSGESRGSRSEGSLLAEGSGRPRNVLFPHAVMSPLPTRTQAKPIAIASDTPKGATPLSRGSIALGW